MPSSDRIDAAPFYFDSFAIVGPRGKKDPLERWRTEDVLAEMEHCGIDCALVTHGLAREYDPTYGNRLLAEEIAKSERLFGCWVLLPHHVGEMAEPAELVREMRRNGIVAGKVYPSTQKFLLDERTCGGLFDALEAERIPLLIEFTQTDQATLSRLCESHPQLPVLLQGYRHGNERMLFPMLDAHENLHVEFSSLQSNLIIELLVERIGPERLLFGTESPIKSPGAARALIDYAAIDDDDRALITGGNLARLLGVLPTNIAMSPPADRVVASARAGRPVTDLVPGADIIDSHAHPVHEGGTGVGMRPQPKGDAGWMFELYDRMGIGTACMASWLGIFADSSAGSDVTAEAVRRDPDRVVGYGTIDPNYVEDVAAEVQRVHSDPGMLGMKPYFPRNGVAYDDPRYTPWWEYANEHHRFALIHSSELLGTAPKGRAGPALGSLLENLTRSYPEVSILLAHSAGSFATARYHIDVASEFERVFFEITLTDVPLGAIELLVENVGADRVLFGTDCPMRDPRPQFGWLAYTHLNEADKLAILGGNMRQILERCR